MRNTHTRTQLGAFCRGKALGMGREATSDPRRLIRGVLLACLVCLMYLMCFPIEGGGFQGAFRRGSVPVDCRYDRMPTPERPADSARVNSRDERDRLAANGDRRITAQTCPRLRADEGGVSVLQPFSNVRLRFVHRVQSRVRFFWPWRRPPASTSVKDPDLRTSFRFSLAMSPRAVYVRERPKVARKKIF